MIKPLQSITLTNDNGEDTTYVVASAPAIVETTEPASVASFSDGAAGIPVKSLIADINPVQNLNGQSAPYPAGGGKNKLPITATTSTVSAVTFTVNADGTISTSGTASADIVFNVCTETLDGTNMVLSGCPSGGSDSGYYMTARISGAWSSVHDTGSELALYGTVDRVAIVVANGTNMNGKTFSPMVRANGTDPSYAPYSNICPITGWTGMNIVRTGKNRFSVDALTGKSIYRANIQKMNDNVNSFYLGGAAGATDNMQLSVNSWAYCALYTGIKVTADTPVVISCKVKNYTADCNGYVSLRTNTTENRAGATSLGTTYFNATGITDISISGTVPSGNYIILEFSPASKSATVTLTQYAEVTEFQLEIGTSTATAFESYNGTTYLTDWGINQWDEEWNVGSISGSTGEDTSGSYFRSKNLIPVSPNTQYYFQRPANTNMWLYAYDANGNFLHDAWGTSTGYYEMGGNGMTKFMPADVYYIRFLLATSYGTTYNNDISINYPSTDHGYHAYADPNAGIVYSGTLDVTTGLLTVTHKMVSNITVGNKLSWASTDSVSIFPVDGTRPTDGVKASTTDLYAPPYYCNRFKTNSVSVGVLTNKETGISASKTSNITYLTVPVSIASTKEEMNAWLSSNQTDIVAELENPLTYQLTPQAVMTILGQNNIWADTGDVEVAYCADTKMYIDKVIAAL